MHAQVDSPNIERLSPCTAELDHSTQMDGLDFGKMVDHVTPVPGYVLRHAYVGNYPP